MATTTTPFSTRVTRAVKAELARRDLDGVDLVEPLKLNRNAVYARLRYEQPFNMDEIEKVALFLNVPLSLLFASAEIDIDYPQAAVA